MEIIEKPINIFFDIDETLGSFYMLYLLYGKFIVYSNFNKLSCVNDISSDIFSEMMFSNIIRPSINTVFEKIINEKKKRRIIVGLYTMNERHLHIKENFDHYREREVQSDWVKVFKDSLNKFIKKKYGIFNFVDIDISEDEDYIQKRIETEYSMREIEPVPIKKHAKIIVERLFQKSPTILFIDDIPDILDKGDEEFISTVYIKPYICSGNIANMKNDFDTKKIINNFKDTIKYLGIVYDTIINFIDKATEEIERKLDSECLERGVEKCTDDKTLVIRVNEFFSH